MSFLLAVIHIHSTFLPASFRFVSQSVAIPTTSQITLVHYLQESEFAAWTLVNGYNLNHAAVSVHRLTGLE